VSLLDRLGLAPGALVRTSLARRGAIVTPLGPDARREIATLNETRRRAPLLMSDAAALHIELCVRAVRDRAGVMAEAGVLHGASARLICENKGEVPLHLFDVFETLQSDAGAAADAVETEIRSHFRTTHGRRAAVEQLLAPYPGVHLHPGVFPGSAKGLDEARFSFVHLDMDLVSSTEAGLGFFHSRLVPGGILIGDDYNDAGVRGAFEAFFAGRPDTLIGLPWGQVMVVKQGS
jgi:hypothetical protein